MTQRSTPRRRAVSGPKDDPHLARLKYVLRGVQDRKELRERAQLPALINTYHIEDFTRVWTQFDTNGDGKIAFVKYYQACNDEAIARRPNPFAGLFGGKK